jgi:hypothetical protein
MTFVEISTGGIDISPLEFRRHSIFAREVKKVLVQRHMSATLPTLDFLI